MPTQTFNNLNEEKKTRILGAAAKEFSQRNVEEAYLSNIVNDAKIARGSFYQYFANKEDLYTYVFEKLRAERSEYVQPAFEFYKTEPFMRFFEEFYVLDSEFLLSHPQHIELGKHLYGHAHGVSRRLIQNIQTKYKEMFLIAIAYDKDRGLISEDINTGSLADLCVHLTTDIFIFQCVMDQLSLRNIKEYTKNMLTIIRKGIEPKQGA
ncbi:MAG: TetR/AcrR family transcriptional regulator [Clostridiales Family XIII bacterium]|jgi:AcrR family transcriptional regulator|nr:TetR/AcrR family transcriptional regulator [Clostridiales Family XIII bacterium]